MVFYYWLSSINKGNTTSPSPNRKQFRLKFPNLKMKKNLLYVATIVAALVLCSPANAQAPSLGAAGSFALF